MPDNANVLDRLRHDFSPLLPEVVIAETVDQCRWELSGVPPAAMPEMLERLARHRLDFLDTSTAWLS